MLKCMFERTWWQSIDCGTNGGCWSYHRLTNGVPCAVHAEPTWRRCVARPVESYHINLLVSLKRFIPPFRIHPEYRTGIRRQRVARSSIYARSRSPVDRTSKYNNTIHHTCIHFIPPIQLVNNPPTSTTPTILKGQTVGLTHHTLYETHRNLETGGILTTKFDTRNPEPHVCFMNMATLCESYGLVVMESASGYIAQCMTQHCHRSDMTHGQ